MKKFKVTASSISYFVLEVEAETQEEAQQIAEQADGGDFDADGLGDWEIYDVKEIE
jgi:hypothetical protein